MLAQGLLALHWFNPLAWAAWSAMRRDQEAACDARAMAGRDLPTRAAYARVIASFAAGERLNSSSFGRAALAAPMANVDIWGPVLGDKSIVHRLRSLTMSDISPRRVRAARWMLGAGAALALPLTATVVYAGQDAPEPPEAPAAPIAPVAPVAPAAPEAPRAPKVVKHVIVIHDDAKHGDPAARNEGDAKFERRIARDGKTIVLSSDHEIDEAQLEAKLAQMEAKLARLDVLGAHEEAMSWAEGDKGQREIVIRRRLGPGGGPAPHAMMFEGKDCAPGKSARAEADASADGQRQIVKIALCGGAGAHRDVALNAMRQARDSIANDGAVTGAVRAQVLQQLDESIADMEKEAK